MLQLRFAPFKIGLVLRGIFKKAIFNFVVNFSFPSVKFKRIVFSFLSLNLQQLFMTCVTEL